MTLKKFLFLISFSIVIAGATGYFYYANSSNTTIIYVNGIKIGEPIDSLNGVYVFYNGLTENVLERHRTWDGYNLGLKYQCVEFVKRYYYERFRHKMPDSYGNAVAYYDKAVRDGKLNRKRGLWQFSNSSRWKPRAEDIIVFDSTATNPYGHIGIISKAYSDRIEIVHQNTGPVSAARSEYKLVRKNGRWFIDNPKVLGRLRLPR